MKLLFRIGYNTAWGESLYLLGSVKELGEWNESKALKMTYEDGIWSTEVDIKRNVKSFEYCYIVAQLARSGASLTCSRLEKKSRSMKSWIPGMTSPMTNLSTRRCLSILYSIVKTKTMRCLINVEASRWRSLLRR